MRAVIQRVMSASVSVGGEVVSSIGRGLCVLIGISRDDTSKDVEYIIRKILNVRVFEDDQGKRWSKSVVDMQYEILCVSQFTLYAVLKGNKPDYHLTMAAEQSEAFYSQFMGQLRKQYKSELIKDGQFGAYMQVSLQNDGPVTINLDSATANSEETTKVKNRGQGQRECPDGAADGETSTTTTTTVQPSTKVDSKTLPPDPQHVN